MRMPILPVDGSAGFRWSSTILHKFHSHEVLTFIPDFGNMLAINIKAYGMANAQMKSPIPSNDLHPADIVAALRKKGLSLSALSRKNGLHRTYLSDTLRKRLPRGERIIARALKMRPEEIWPSRYPARIEARAAKQAAA